mmetsp:Transcript_141362/g.393950  ORF Transcript_141362/g.393950 Transcript_141362/m.393950 type:complete len:208 (+) Transcript_141362:918-1541(+)
MGYMATCSIMPAQLPATACCQKGVDPSHSSHSNDSELTAAGIKEELPVPNVSPPCTALKAPLWLPWSALPGEVKWESIMRMVSYVPQHIAAEGMARATRGPRPRKNPPGPSCFAMSFMVEAMPSYLSTLGAAADADAGGGRPPWVWRRVFTTSKGSVNVEARAPLSPAAKKYHGAPENLWAPVAVVPVPPRFRNRFKDSFVATRSPM